MVLCAVQSFPGNFGPASSTLNHIDMSLPAGISRIPITDWQNGHLNFSVGLTKDASFNMRLPFAFNQNEDNYRATTKNFQWLIQHAIDNGLTLRALGNGWSFSDVAVCKDGLVDTRELRTFFKIADSFLSPAYLATGKTADDLVFTQCGMSILQMHKELESENGWLRSMKASGASNGQTIVGATATGTHGSAMAVGAVHDAIRGLHIITGPDKHVWIERASQPVASDEFIAWLGATPIRDDAAFNAAVVSFGSFGFIHSVLIETDPIYLLKKFVRGPLAYTEAVRHAINTWDFTGIEDLLPFPLNSPNKELYHFEVVVNPHRFAKEDPENGVFIKTIYKLPYFTGYPPPNTESGKFQYGDELLGVMQSVLDAVGKPLRQKLIPPIVNKLFPLAYAAVEEVTGTIGEMFNNTKFRGQAASAAMAIDSKDASRAIEEIVSVNSQSVFAGGIALRFVKGTPATLGFTHFAKTCVLELDGVESKSSRKFFEKVWNRFEALGIPYTLHWGKVNFILNEERILSMYGENAVNQWKSWREKLLDEPTRKVFTNDFMVRCGLAG